MSIENDIVYISCPKRTFCDFIHGSSLAIRLNTINLQNYFKIKQVIHQNQIRTNQRGS